MQRMINRSKMGKGVQVTSRQTPSQPKSQQRWTETQQAHCDSEGAVS